MAETLRIEMLFPIVRVTLARDIIQHVPDSNLLAPVVRIFAHRGDVVTVQGLRAEPTNADVAIRREDGEIIEGRLSELLGAVVMPLIEVPAPELGESVASWRSRFPDAGPPDPREQALRLLAGMIRQGRAGLDSYDPAALIVGPAADHNFEVELEPLSELLLFAGLEPALELGGSAARFLIVDREALLTGLLELGVERIGEIQTILASRAAR